MPTSAKERTELPFFQNVLA